MTDYRSNHDLIRDLAFGHYLEIGVNVGDSLIAALEAGVELAVGIDTWGDHYGGEGKGSPDYVLSRLTPIGRSKTILLTGDSKSMLPRLSHAFTCILVDGDHSPEGLLSDLTLTLPLLMRESSQIYPNTRSKMIVDDLDHPAHPYIRNIVLDFAKQNGFDVDIHLVHTGMAVLHWKE